MEKKRFTIIINEVIRRGSHSYTVTRLHRVICNSVEELMNSKYGDYIVFLFNEWPAQVGETNNDNEWGLPVIEI